MTNILQIPMLLDTGEPLDSCVVLKGDTRWKDCLEEFKTCRLFGFDIETFGLDKEDGLNPWKGSIRLVQVALPSKRVMIADFGGFNDARADRINEYAEFLSVLQTQLYSRDVYTVGHNLKFDCLFMLVQFGFETRSTRDTMLMSQVLWAGVKAYSHSLKSVAARLGLGDVDKTEQTSDWGWGLTNAQLNYAAKDALIVLKMLFTLGKELEKAKLTGSAKAECEALPAFVQMDYVGFPVNESKLDAALSQWQEAETPLLKPFTDEFPEVNPNAPHAVVAALNAKYGLGVSSSDKDALTPFADKYPAVKHLLLWRSLTTSIDYLKGIKAEIRAGSVRGVYRQIAPRGFGRSTSGNKSAAAGMRGVNLQNPRNPGKIPPEIRALNLPEERSVFEVPQGYKLLVADLSSAHARIATEVSQDPALVEAYRSGKDIHSVTGSSLAKLQGLDWDWKYIAKTRKIKGHPDAEMCEGLRLAAKPTFFGCVPLDAEALTRTGWKNYLQLSVGDEIMAYNPDSGKNEWTPILALNYYDDAPLFRLKSGGGNRLCSDTDDDNGASFNVRVTADHKWIGQKRRRVGRHLGPGKGNASVYVEEFIRTCEITTNDRIYVAAPSEGGSGIEKIPLQKYDFDWIQYVLSMTETERRGFLAGVLVGEGHICYSHAKTGKKGKYPSAWGFTQNPGNIADAMILAAFLEGYRVSVNYDKGTSNQRYLTKRIKLYTHPVVTGQKIKVIPSGSESVWCPTTKFGTWVMRQGNTITITGNSLNAQGWKTLQDTARTEASIEMSDELAQQAIQAWRTAYSKLFQFQRDHHRKCNRTHATFPGVKGIWAEVRGLSGRRCFMQKMTSPFDESRKPEIKLTDAVSFVWTSCEADVIKIAMAGCLLEADNHPEWELKLVNCCHDELDFTVREEYAVEAAKTVRLMMAGAMRLFIKSIPVEEEGAKAESMICSSWAEK